MTLRCGPCGGSVRGPWTFHATAARHARATRGPVVRMRAATIRRQNAGASWQYYPDPWSRDDGRDYAQERRT